MLLGHLPFIRSLMQPFGIPSALLIALSLIDLLDHIVIDIINNYSCNIYHNNSSNSIISNSNNNNSNNNNNNCNNCNSIIISIIYY
jgi:hypothetical protein